MKCTFTHEELLNLKWLVENTDMLTDDMQQMLSLKLTKMLAEDGLKFEIAKTPSFRH